MTRFSSVGRSPDFLVKRSLNFPLTKVSSDPMTLWSSGKFKDLLTRKSRVRPPELKSVIILSPCRTKFTNGWRHNAPLLKCVAVHCNALQCIAMRCSALRYVAARCSALQYVAVRCSALQRNALPTHRGLQKRHRAHPTLYTCFVVGTL